MTDPGIPQLDGCVFKSKEVDAVTAERLKCLKVSGEALMRKKSFPYFLIILTQILIFYISVFVFIFSISVIKGTSLKTVYLRNPAFVIAGAASLLLVLVLLILMLRNKKRLGSDPGLKNLTDEYMGAYISALNKLGVPDTAIKADVLYCFYKIRGSQTVSESPGNYYNDEKSIYRSGGFLHFAGCLEVISIPLESITGIIKINKKIYVPKWNKNEPYNSRRYKKHRIIAKNRGCIEIKNHYSLEINDPRGSFNVLIPEYDIKDIAELTGQTKYYF